MEPRVQECLGWLHECRQRKVAIHATQRDAPPASQPIAATDTTRDVSGSHVAELFAQEASKNLSDEQFTQLGVLLGDPSAAGGGRRGPKLHETLSSLLDNFYSEEPRRSGQPRDRLATPGGPPHADLGIVLHTQSKDGRIGF